MGMSRRHRANPVASLRAENIFATPVLLSGTASLLLSKSESEILALHVKETTENLLKLHSKTPEPVVFFLAGRLPGEALLHLRQLTLFGMICHLPGNILHTIATQLLTSAAQSNKNWFAEIRSLCFQYNLPHPLLLLKEPISKIAFKTLIKSKVTDFWQQKLRAHAAKLEESSLKYFKPQYMSLSHPHPMWRNAITSYQVNKCIVVSRMLSGRFRCGSLLRHFYPNISGLCELCGDEMEDLPHILLPRCPQLQERADMLMRFSVEKLSENEVALSLFKTIMNGKDDKLKVQMLLDPSAVPIIIAETQKDGTILQSLLSATTTWCYSINRTRNKLLGK